MNGTLIFRNAALVLAIAAITATAGAQTVSTGAQYLAVVGVAYHDDEALLDETRGATDMVGRVATAAASVDGVEADAQVRDAIERRVLQGTADAKVVRTVLSGDRWLVKMSELGVPRNEYRKGFVVYQVKGTDRVVTQQIVVERPFFADGDKYSVKLGPVKE